ncbi:hypothetical protein ACIBW9_36850 [Streptomyces sp. NPDC049541]|uniref:hypothetical protein n=1 Tax=Streptomyces sp. NPDC049541 TaxID=3365594 RepID=UPI003787C6AA
MITSPLTPEQRTVYWTVAAYDTRGRSVSRSTGLLSVSPARYWHKFWSSRPETARMELAEHTLVTASTLIGFADLPGKGQPTLLPELPAGAHEVKRFFRFARALENGSLTGFGPTVLRTGDDVRYFYEWTVKNQERAQAVRVDVSTLRVLDITLTHYTRELQLADLPDDDTTALMGQLEAEGLYWIPVHESTGPYLRVPLADGSEVTIRRTGAPGREVGYQQTTGDRGDWLAVWGDFNDSSGEVYRSRRDLTRAADTAALAAAVLKCADEHGGCPVLRDAPRQSHA